MGSPVLARRSAFLALFASDQQLSRLLSLAMADLPLSPDEFALTSTLRLTGPIRPTDLAGTLGMRPTTLSNYLRRLTESGVLIRQPDPSDGRASLVRLSPEGERLTLACFGAFGRATRAFSAALAEEAWAEPDYVAALEAGSRALEVAIGHLRESGA